MNPDEKDITQLIGERETAMRARDAATLVGGYTPDVVKFDLAPPLRTAGAAARDADGLAAWFDGFDGTIDYEVTELAVTAGDEVAFSHSLNRLSATPHGGSEAFTLWFRATLGLRLVDGAWRIAHEHNSTPFSMDGSFRASVDLTP